jgi:mono/diheme cytochrome c family protein
MNRRLYLVVAALVSASHVGCVEAQDVGDVSRGFAVAHTICAECHAVDKGQLRSRNAQAPTFESLANDMRLSPVTVRAALRTSHREMPNLNLRPEEVDDLIAYLSSLR